MAQPVPVREPELIREPEPMRETELVAVAGDDGVFLVLDTETGEVIGVPDAPITADGKAMSKADVEWYADRRTRAQVRLAGLEAGKARELLLWRENIDRMYAQRLKQEVSLLSWLDRQYLPGLEQYTARALVGAKTKSILIGAVKLFFKLTSPGVDVVDEPVALAWLKAHAPEAIAVKETVAKLKLPKGEEFPPESGLKRREQVNEFRIE